MFKLPAVVTIVISTVSLLSGCGYLDDTFGGFEEPFIGKIDAVAPRPVLPRGNFEQIDIIQLLTPGDDPPLTEYASDAEEARALEKAFRSFYAADLDLERRRNRIQERVLGASALRCGIFEDYLKRKDVTFNLLFGTLTTVTAGLGAILTPASTVRALAGTAAISSGLRAEFNDAFFQQLTVQVITNGIRIRRARIYSSITGRQGETITAYPVEAALRDAIEYDNACSLVVGLEESALTIARVSDPGLNRLVDVRSAIALASTPIIPSVDTATVRALDRLPSVSFQSAREKFPTFVAKSEELANISIENLNQFVRPNCNVDDPPASCNIEKEIVSFDNTKKNLEESLELIKNSNAYAVLLNEAEWKSTEDALIQKEDMIVALQRQVVKAATDGDANDLLSAQQALSSLIIDLQGDDQDYRLFVDRARSFENSVTRLSMQAEAIESMIDAEVQRNQNN